MDSKRWLLLVLALMGLLKGVWGVFAPHSMKRITGSFMRVAKQVNTLLAITAFGLAIAIWAFVLMNEDTVTLALLLYGLFFAWAGSIYLNREHLGKMVSKLILDREDAFIRAMCLIVCLVCGVIVWIALK